MWHASNYYRTIGSGLAIFLSACLVAPTAEAAAPSALSKWLSKRAMPELRERLQQHPRYRDQRIAIVATANNALSDALVTLLRMNLENRASIALSMPPQENPVAIAVPASIDALDCNLQTGFQYVLQVAAQPGSGGKGEVNMRLAPIDPAERSDDSWHWKGKFNPGEREYVERVAEALPADGSLAAPWTKEQVENAARRLSRELACALRPQLGTHLALQWPEQPALPPLFTDTINASRHLLGSYRQLGHGGEDADYQISVELQRFGDDTWQLWLLGKPRRTPLLPVQAVTYFQVADQHWPVQSAAQVSNRQGAGLPLGAAKSAAKGAAVDFIDVEMLDATQSDNGRTSADLAVTLRIANRADWALEYSFSLSGGHFNHCIADPAYYRHDGYGQLKGRIDAGHSVVRRLLISGTQHRPTPYFGTPKCAGFRDLDGFEDFAEQGYKVTDFVRWDIGGEMSE
jgi:hypothetical protein